MKIKTDEECQLKSSDLGSSHKVNETNHQIKKLLDEIYDCFEDCEIDSKGIGDPSDLVGGFMIKNDEWVAICKKYRGRF